MLPGSLPSYRSGEAGRFFKCNGIEVFPAIKQLNVTLKQSFGLPVQTHQIIAHKLYQMVNGYTTVKTEKGAIIGHLKLLALHPKEMDCFFFSRPNFSRFHTCFRTRGIMQM